MPTTARVAETRSERLIEDLLSAQGWDLRRPPQGELLVKQEYKDYPDLREALVKSGKGHGSGSGIPEYILVDHQTGEPLAVIEAKARASDIDGAVRDVQHYGSACVEAGLSPLAIAVAGTEEDAFQIRVLKWVQSRWQEITYEGKPIRWIPNREQVQRVRQARGTVELRPAVPPSQVLKEKADEINRLLRESGLKDEFRPAAVGAIMLALWKSGGALRRDKRFILGDINQACGQAFWDAGKPELSHSLRVDEANEKLAIRAKRICQILERLNITSLSAEHDYLGTLYEEFFRYTGGNTIGQYFTPRHVTRFMADLCEVSASDIVLDPACGTGGFLIAAMERVQRTTKPSRQQLVQLVQKQLVGMDNEPVTAALCVANMILRGDGSSGVLKADCFDDTKFPFRRADVVLMNPPFPHEKTDTPPEKFINRALEGLATRGKAAIIVPASLLVRADKQTWRESLLREHTLLAVISLPDELFQPYASSTTAILLIEKGVPHGGNRRTFFCRIANDGYRLKKGVRVPQPGSEMDRALQEFLRLGSIPGFCGAAPLRTGEEWAPGAYIPARPPSMDELHVEIADLIRAKTAFVVRFTPQIKTLLAAVTAGDLTAKPYTEIVGGKSGNRKFNLTSGGTLGDAFDIYYGQKELHSKERLVPGKALVISSSGGDNGCYGFFDFNNLIAPPFATVPSTGSIGEAFVQDFPCGVTDDCLILVPKPKTPYEALYVAAAVLRRERWRFNYGRKMTPERIAGFLLPATAATLRWIKKEIAKAKRVEKQALAVLADVH